MWSLVLVAFSLVSANLALPAGSDEKALFECTQNGIFPKPGSCASYYICLGGKFFEDTCPISLIFDPKTSACNYPDVLNIVGCTAKEFFNFDCSADAKSSSQPTSRPSTLPAPPAPRETDTEKYYYTYPYYYSYYYYYPYYTYWYYYWRSSPEAMNTESSKTSGPTSIPVHAERTVKEPSSPFEVEANRIYYSYYYPYYYYYYYPYYYSYYWKTNDVEKSGAGPLPPMVPLSPPAAARREGSAGSKTEETDRYYSYYYPYYYYYNYYWYSPYSYWKKSGTEEDGGHIPSLPPPAPARRSGSTGGKAEDADRYYYGYYGYYPYNYGYAYYPYYYYWRSGATDHAEEKGAMPPMSPPALREGLPKTKTEGAARGWYDDYYYDDDYYYYYIWKNGGANRGKEPGSMPPMSPPALREGLPKTKTEGAARGWYDDYYYDDDYYYYYIWKNGGANRGKEPGSMPPMSPPALREGLPERRTDEADRYYYGDYYYPYYYGSSYYPYYYYYWRNGGANQADEKAAMPPMSPKAPHEGHSERKTEETDRYYYYPSSSYYYPYYYSSYYYPYSSYGYYGYYRDGAPTPGSNEGSRTTRMAPVPHPRHGIPPMIPSSELRHHAAAGADKDKSRNYGYYYPSYGYYPTYYYYTYWRSNGVQPESEKIADSKRESSFSEFRSTMENRFLKPAGTCSSYYYLCMANGQPRLLSCPDDFVFNFITGNCGLRTEVGGCKDP